MWSRFLNSNKQNSQKEAGKRIYLDYAAATPVAKEVVSAMLPYFSENYGNAGGIHKEGVVAKKVLEEARQQAASILGVQSAGVVFTSGGTESNNLAIRGLVEKMFLAGRAYADMAIITTKLEHPATLKTLDSLAKLGVEIIFAPVTEEGMIDTKSLAGLLSPKVVLVTISYVNSEVGAINRCREVRRIIDAFAVKSGERPLLHVDAAQAPLWLPCDLPRLGADLLSLDAGKMCGPKGVGILAMQKGVAIAPITYGGGQEMGLRPGTEPLPLVVGTVAALTLAQNGYENRAVAVAQVRDYMLEQIAKYLPQAVVNGPSGDNRVANNVHVSILGLDSEFAVISLDAKGIACSTKSACSSKGGGASAVVLAMTGDEARATSTLRFTLSPEITEADVDVVVNILKEHVATLPKF